MTPATKLLKANKIDFSIHEYEHDANAKSFGLEAAEKLNLRVEEVRLSWSSNLQALNESMTVSSMSTMYSAC